MPRYELILISRILGREGFAHLLRQTCTSIMDKGGVVRKLENLGQQRLPQRMRAHAEWHHIGRYFLFDFELSTHQLPQFEKELKTDPEVIQNGIVKIQSRFDSKKYEHPILECWKTPSRYQFKSHQRNMKSTRLAQLNDVTFLARAHCSQR
ncbi:28S ribosomal protein S6, mitochondrial [Exaiptasia diaphana]|nr:28S ribosomal protein S6, mitochondrial [Exaiptasia diaphana]